MKFLSTLISCVFLATSVSAQKKPNYPPEIEGATEHIYKEASDTRLKLWRFAPAYLKKGEQRPAIVFFFGGGWKAGSPNQFVPHSKHLAEKGMVALVADYRVSSRHETKAKDCVEDARDAIRYIRKNATELGVDPKRLAAGGGSAGGHIAACLGVIEADKASRPDALALFNPACVLAPLDGKNPWKEDRHAELKDRMGTEPEALSPAHHVGKGEPPCVIFHGKADITVPYATAESFHKKMTEAGADSTLHGYEGEPHGFFNFGRKSKVSEESAYDRILPQLDAFFIELGWIQRSS
ncbi:alpha/beta hydrolase [bacterium]|nr:alpha/beta hydrolase [bacterium]